ncbi:hypothetical protein LTR84_000217 [Exophiala bonariae]|uniref:Uncharacterized protein n=1 Tax=Exophiala bonariae TaxID=1690606 RepID=A0AAV9NRQ5_9EURO|nr:hypothetical protein LTR84_000217 [Exophiala bonariae]
MPIIVIGSRGCHYAFIAPGCPVEDLETFATNNKPHVLFVPSAHKIVMPMVLEKQLEWVKVDARVKKDGVPRLSTVTQSAIKNSGKEMVRRLQSVLESTTGVANWKADIKEVPQAEAETVDHALVALNWCEKTACHNDNTRSPSIGFVDPSSVSIHLAQRTLGAACTSWLKIFGNTMNYVVDGRRFIEAWLGLDGSCYQMDIRITCCSSLHGVPTTLSQMRRKSQDLALFPPFSATYQPLLHALLHDHSAVASEAEDRAYEESTGEQDPHSSENNDDSMYEDSHVTCDLGEEDLAILGDVAEEELSAARNVNKQVARSPLAVKALEDLRRFVQRKIRPSLLDRIASVTHCIESAHLPASTTSASRFQLGFTNILDNIFAHAISDI